MPDTHILKVGGSVITHKDAERPTLNAEHLRRIAQDVARWRRERGQRLIFVSGAGSFGHPLARAYQLNAPHAQKDALGFVRTTATMLGMAAQVAAAFHALDVPLCPITTSAIFTTADGRITAWHTAPILHALEAGLIPYLWGDAVFDRTHRFRILSGDQIVTFLAAELEIAHILYGTDVDGIYTADPHRDPRAEHLAEITDANYAHVRRRLSASAHTDVTGGMRGKIEELRRTPKRPLRAVIFDATRPQSTYRALSGQLVGTRLFFREPPAP